MSARLTGTPDHVTITTGEANTLTEVKVNSRVVSFHPIANAAKAVTGTPAVGLEDAGVLGAADFIPLLADTPRRLSCLGTNGERRETSWFVTSETPGTKIVVIAEREL